GDQENQARFRERGAKFDRNFLDRLRLAQAVSILQSEFRTRRRGADGAVYTYARKGQFRGTRNRFEEASMLCRLSIVILAAVPLFAQSRGTIQGDVVDPTGAAIPKASLRIQSTAIGLDRRVSSGETGEFNVPSLPR